MRPKFRNFPPPPRRRWVNAPPGLTIGTDRDKRKVLGHSSRLDGEINSQGDSPFIHLKSRGFKIMNCKSCGAPRTPDPGPILRVLLHRKPKGVLMPTGIYERKTGLGLRRMTPVELRGYRCYLAQLARCRRRKEYAGLAVAYGPKEFIAWFVREFAKRQKWHRPNVSRIDHEKGYSFDNIQLQECSENSLERIARKGSPSWGVKRKVLAIAEDGLRQEFSSVTDAARFFNLSHCTVRHYCNGKRRFPHLKVVFQWAK